MLCTNNCNSFSKFWSYLNKIIEAFNTLQKNYTKKDLKDPDNHDGMTTHQKSDILECEVKWALGSITMNKTSGRDGIPAELFQILKDDAVKVLLSICQHIFRT